MNRREFNAMMLSGVAASALPTPGFSRGGHEWLAAPPPMVNGDRLNAHLKALSVFGKNPEGGVSRVAYSDADKAGRATVIEWMRAAKLDPKTDFAGNIIARRPGTVASLKPILFGSHIDSVPGGGNYDGDLGTLSAIEIAQTFAEHNITTRHPLEIVIWQNEEGGLFGSRAVSGQLTAAELKIVSNSGKTIEQGITFLGGDPTKLDQVKRKKGDIAGYFELHIEQGGTLEATKTNVGIVEGIVGIKQWEVTVSGFQNHAGTTAMDQRHDALLSAAKFVQMVNAVVRGVPGHQVGTVGRIQAFPGAPNVIPGKVVCTLELRDLDDKKVDSMYATIRGKADAIGKENGTSFAYSELHVNASAPSDTTMRKLIADAARSLNLSTRIMPSGAGHDAQAMATLGPMGMIFIPSIGGISHAPKEYSTPQDCVNGANVLLRAVLGADALA